MGELDLGAKVVLREDPDAVLRLVGPDLPLRATRLVDTEHVKLERRMDTLVEASCEAVGRCWLHFEFLAAWKHDAPRVTFGRWSLAARTYDPLLSIVVVMKPDLKQGQPKGEEAWRFGPMEVNRFKFRAVCLWHFPVERFLADPSLAPLAPFGAEATEETTERAMECLERVSPEARQAELRVALGFLAGNVFPDRPWLDTIPRELLMTSMTYQQIQAECESRGEARERVRLVTSLLQSRLHERAQPLLTRLEGCSADLATRILELATTHREDEELLAALEALITGSP